MKKASWLHWIGNEYDNTVKFLAEGRRDGVRRPVTLKQLAALSWNDDIYCVKAQGAKEGSVFCRVPVTRLSGLSQEVWELLTEKFTSTLTGTKGRFVENVTGSYVIGDSCKIMANMQDIAVVLERETKKGVDIGKLMIGCYSTDLVTLPPPWGVLANVEKFKGFIQFSAARFEHDMSRIRIGPNFDKKLSAECHAEVKVSGEYPGDVEWINDYQELDFKTDARQTEFDFAV